MAESEVDALLADAGIPLLEQDRRADAQNVVAMVMPVDEFDGFVGLLNRANITMEFSDNGLPYRLTFTPEFVGPGLVTLEIGAEEVALPEVE